MVQAMTESKFYSELLGLESPLEVESVQLDTSDNMLQVADGKSIIFY